MASQLDLIVLGLGGLLAVLYLFRESLFGGAKDTGSKLANGAALTATDEGGADFVSKLKSQKKRILTNEKNRQRGVAVRSRLRTLSRRFVETLEAGDREAAEKALRAALRAEVFA